ncbi:hypothetical protein TNCV_335571 [Trichonephila clavipes]|nr:hypothetical protein TNCV_335571 [Trichonephila clavipes]
MHPEEIKLQSRNSARMRSLTILRLRMPLRRNRRQYEQLTDFDRGRILGLREAGWSNRRIGRHRTRSERYGSCSVLATVDHRR